MMHTHLSLAKSSALKAGELIVSLLGNAVIERKAETYNLVTEADKRAETVIIDILKKEMPGVSILSEETHCDTKLDADTLWIIDPVDGTTNFAHGIPHFGISVAYAEKGVVKAGVVYDPMRRELFSATLGGGAFCNDRPIRTSSAATLSQSLIGTGFYYDRGELMKKTLRALHGLFNRNVHCMRRMGAATLDLAWLACGRFDGYFEYTLSPWDFAAGLLILTEAGGRASDNLGAEASLFSKGLLCSNGLIHRDLLEIVLAPEPF